MTTGLKIKRNEFSRDIEEFLAQKGARRFEFKGGADFYSIKIWLLERGVQLDTHKGTYRWYRTGSLRKPVKIKIWRNVLRRVDNLRVKEGLLPILIDHDDARAEEI